MKTSIQIVSLLLLFSCSAKRENEIVFPNGVSFQLKKGEKIISNAQALKDFEALLGQNNIQLPLYKCINAKGYVIYIVLPYRASLAKLYADSTLISSNFQLQKAVVLSPQIRYKKFEDKTRGIALHFYAEELTTNNLAGLVVLDSSATHERWSETAIRERFAVESRKKNVKNDE